MSVDLFFREHTWDRNIWISVNESNEYLMDIEFDPEDGVLDIGAHIGAFTHRVLKSGAGRVVAVEPDPGNYQSLVHNLHTACRATDRAILIPGAAVGRRVSDQLDCVYAAGGTTNTGGVNTLGTNGIPVAAVDINDLVRITRRDYGTPIRLLKLDCEGAEWGILEHIDLAQVGALVGEWHAIDNPEDWPALQLSGPRGRDWLKVCLSRAGYRVATKPTSSHLGIFWAWRENQEFASVWSDE